MKCFCKKMFVFFISPSIQDAVCCALMCLRDFALKGKLSLRLNLRWQLTAPPRSAGPLCFVALLPSRPSFLPFSLPPTSRLLPPKQIKSLVVLGNARSDEAGWSEAQKDPNMVFKRREMEASALMERIIVVGAPPPSLRPSLPVNTIKQGSGPGRLPGAAEVSYLG